MNDQESLEYAKKYLGDIVSFFGGNIAIEAELDDEFVNLRVPSSELNSILIGRNAETLRSLQYLLSTTLRNKGASRDRVNLDIADYKKQREEKIAEQARSWIEQVRKTGDSHIAHLNAADRRVVHHIASEYDDIETFSEGEGRERVITIAQRSS